MALTKVKENGVTPDKNLWVNDIGSVCRPVVFDRTNEEILPIAGTISIPGEMYNSLKQLTHQTNEVAGQMFGKLTINDLLHFNVEDYKLSQPEVSSRGFVETREKVSTENYNQLFHTHSAGTLRSFNTAYSRNFSIQDILSLQDIAKYKDDKVALDLLVTPEDELGVAVFADGTYAPLLVNVSEE